MHIGYDSKRAFQNSTGLGNYARSLISALAEQYPENYYTLFAPKQTLLYNIAHFSNINVVLPQTKFDKTFPSWWRRRNMVNDIAKNNIDIFHGVSNELPSGIENTSVKTVITVHDLIFERYPETYHWDERYTHRWKMKRSCRIANAVIATSQQTKKDLVDFYKIPTEKIFVCYQNCNSIFEQSVSEEEKLRIKKKYLLPDQFFLFVSSITKRKNLLSVCKALTLLKDKTAIPLVIIGDGKKEKEAVKKYIDENGLAERVFF
jgi:glycosyltransferase involved in cell wall biosynthesis